MEQLCAQPNITGVTVKQQLPVELSGNAIGHQYSFSLHQLPAEQYLELFEPPKTTSSDLPLVWINKYISFSDEQIDWALSQLPPADADGMLVSLADIEAAERERAANLLRSMMRLPKRGDRAQMLLPQVRTDGMGEYAVDATDPVPIEVEIAGVVSIPTRTLAWWEGGAIVTETGYVHGANLYVTADTWQRIWSSAAPETTQPLYNVTLRVTDLDRLQSTVVALSQQFPQFALIDVSQFAARMEQTTRLDRFYRAPRYIYSQAENASLVIPAALGPAVGCLLLLIAALLIASRMLTGVAARRMEIGILKTLGARRKDIMLMALTEALLIALIGSFAGFSLLRMAGLFTELSNGVPWSEMLRRTVRDGGLVMSVACLTSLLFALLPAMRLSRLSVMEVLRGD